MFDKITIRAKLSSKDCWRISNQHHMTCWNNTKCTKVEYRNGEDSKITGIEVSIKNDFLTLKTSLHKFWYLRNYGVLRNDKLFTVSEAKSAFEMLLFENGLVAKNVYITQFEIGLNLNVSYDPLTFIEIARSIQTTSNKMMFVDANYHINRQRTTEKHKDIRKYFKMYDKGFEMNQKSKEPKKIKMVMMATMPKILRIETCSRRYKERSDKFFMSNNIDRLVNRFYLEWKNLIFKKDVIGKKGTRKSEIDRAKLRINEGEETYLKNAKSDFDNRLITENQYRTIREFIRDFKNDQSKFDIIISKQEKEYNELLTSTYILAKL